MAVLDVKETRPDPILIRNGRNVTKSPRARQAFRDAGAKHEEERVQLDGATKKRIKDLKAENDRLRKLYAPAAKAAPRESEVLKKMEALKREARAKAKK